MFATFDRIRLRYRILKLRALCWVLLRLVAPARGGAFLGPRGDEFTGKTSRAVIARTIIDGSTSDMMESSSVSVGKLARRLTGKASLTLPRQQSERHRAREVGLGISSKLRRNLARHMMKSWCGTGATRRRTGQRGGRDESGITKAPGRPRAKWRRAARPGAGGHRLGRKPSLNYSAIFRPNLGQSWRLARAGRGAQSGSGHRISDRRRYAALSLASVARDVDETWLKSPEAVSGASRKSRPAASRRAVQLSRLQRQCQADQQSTPRAFVPSLARRAVLIGQLLA